MTPQQILTLARVPNIPTVWTNVLTGWILAGGQAGWGLGLSLLGGTLLYAGGCTLNDAFDARWDRAHKPDRLIPSLALTVRQVAVLGAVEMGLGVVFFIAAGPGTLILPLALAGCILAYDFRHKENPQSVLVMGACRALLIFSAAGAAGDAVRWPVLAAATVMWLYIVGLSLLARRESQPGGGMLRSLRPEWPVGRWVGELLAAIALVDAAVLLTLGGGRLWAVAVCLLSWPLCRLLQRKYAAT